MENQINIDDQKIQQIGQNPINQPPVPPVTGKPKINDLVIGAIILIGIIVLGFGGYYLSKQSSLNNFYQDQITVPQAKTNNDATTNWKTYTGASVSFKYPGDWAIDDRNNYSPETLVAFLYKLTIRFSVSEIQNYNTLTGKPFASLKEYLGYSPSSNIVENTVINGRPAIIQSGGDGGHLAFFQTVVILSPNNKSIITLTSENFETPGKIDSELVQILSTFKFLSDSAPTSTILSNKLTTYKTANFSIEFPQDWKVSTKQIEYYDSPTLELTKTSGTKTAGVYELPEVWIGSFEIYSTSGAICANEPECPKVDKITFTIIGKNYSTDVFRRQIWESGKFTGKYFYVFQIGSQSELDSVPSKPTITGQYETAVEKLEIENILSSITY